jgi:hypothetical protein
MNKNLDRNDRKDNKGVNNSESKGYTGEGIKSLALYIKKKNHQIGDSFFCFNTFR